MEIQTPIPAVEEGHRDGYGITSAHTIGCDSWQQVGLMLATGFNCGYILSFSNLILVPLGWKWGIICMFVVAFYTAYAQWLLAAFHFINGQRFIRFRDLMGFLYGRKMYYVTWVMQYATLLLFNVGFILLAATALKEINSELSDSPLRLQIFIIITGVAFFMFAIAVPTMSAMRMWLLVSFFFTSIYISILLVFLVKDAGKSNRRRDYEVEGSKADKVFNALGAISSIVFSNTAGMVPEMQSTLRQPVVQNMRKALYTQFTVGILFYFGLTIVGYWAYGSSVSTYLPEQINAAKWVKLLLNSVVFLQTIISQHMFIAPVHETIDTKFLKLEDSMFSRENIKRRLCLRLIVFTGITFLAAAFPFIGDFVNLVGSFTLIPLTFLFASMVFLKVKGKTARVEKKAWHWFNIVVFSLLTVATTVAAVRLVIKHIQDYSFFADA